MHYSFKRKKMDASLASKKVALRTPDYWGFIFYYTFLDEFVHEDAIL